MAYKETIQQVSVGFDKKFLEEKLDILCKKEKRSRANLINKIVMEYFENIEMENKNLDTTR